MSDDTDRLINRTPEKVADNAAETAHPVPVGGKFNSAEQSYDDGDRAFLQVDGAGHLKSSIFKLRPGKTQTVSVTSATTATASAVEARNARLVSDVACHFVVASSPSATTSDPLLPANAAEEIGIRNGEKVATIKTSGGGTGTLFVSELKTP